MDNKFMPPEVICLTGELVREFVRCEGLIELTDELLFEIIQKLAKRLVKKRVWLQTVERVKPYTPVNPAETFTKKIVGNKGE